MECAFLAESEQFLKRIDIKQETTSVTCTGLSGTRRGAAIMCCTFLMCWEEGDRKDCS